jgi:hypothetical protein
MTTGRHRVPHLALAFTGNGGRFYGGCLEASVRRQVILANRFYEVYLRDLYATTPSFRRVSIS